MSCSKPHTSFDKWSMSMVSGLLFLLVSSPVAYGFSNKFLEKIGLETSYDGCPNFTGMFIHAVLFTLILRLLMEKKDNDCTKPYNTKDKWIVAIIGGMMYLIFSSPFLYDFVNTTTETFGFPISKLGCPNTGGLVLHSIMFVMMARLLMR